MPRGRPATPTAPTAGDSSGGLLRIQRNLRGTKSRAVPPACFGRYRSPLPAAPRSVHDRNCPVHPTVERAVIAVGPERCERARVRAAGHGARVGRPGRRPTREGDVVRRRAVVPGPGHGAAGLYDHARGIERDVLQGHGAGGRRRSRGRGKRQRRQCRDRRRRGDRLRRRRSDAVGRARHPVRAGRALRGAHAATAGRDSPIDHDARHRAVARIQRLDGQRGGKPVVEVPRLSVPTVLHELGRDARCAGPRATPLVTAPARGQERRNGQGRPAGRPAHCFTTWPRISPAGCKTVWTFTYACPLRISTSSESSVIFMGGPSCPPTPAARTPVNPRPLDLPVVYRFRATPALLSTGAGAWMWARVTLSIPTTSTSKKSVLMSPT